MYGGVAYSVLGTAAWNRLISLLGAGGTCSFLVMMADGFGYMGTTSLLLYQTFGSALDVDQTDESHDGYLETFIILVYLSSVTMMLCFVFAAVYFFWKSGSFVEIKRYVCIAWYVCFKL